MHGVMYELYARRSTALVPLPATWLLVLYVYSVLSYHGTAAAELSHDSSRLVCV